MINLTNSETTNVNVVIDDHKQTDSSAPALYITSYGRYNEYGGLSGMWVDMSTFYDVDDFNEFLTAYLGKNAEPMFCDFENLPEGLYTESYDQDNLELLFEWLKLGENEQKIVAEYWCYIDSNCTDFQAMIDACVYQGDDFTTYYDELADEMISSCDAPECITRYFDYAQWERDCSFDYTEGDECLFAHY